MRRCVSRSGLAFVFGLVLLAGLPVFGQDKFLGKIMEALPDKAPVQPKQPRKILIYSRTAGFRHSSIPVGIKAITMMGDKTGAYTAHATEDEAYFEPEKLKHFDAVFMLNTTGDCLRPKSDMKEIAEIEKALANLEGKVDEESDSGKDLRRHKKELINQIKKIYAAEATNREELLKKSLADFVAGGKGLIGVHSATDTYHGWKDYNMMMGGTFDGHPWHTKVPVKNLEPKHPLNAAFGGMDFEITDEIYQFRADTALPTDRRFLLSLDTEKMDVSKGKRKDGLYPVSWVSTFGKGRTFYCSLGHREEIYWNPAVLKHYLAGIQYAVGDLPADAAPTAKAADNDK
jgi:type 1 glutamine amidotransferase